MMPSMRNGIRPAQEEGPTEAGSGAIRAMHTAAQYEEKGCCVTVSIGEGAQRPGLTLSLQTRWGAARGAGMLWQDQVYRPLALGPESAGGAVHAQVSYRLRLLGGGWTRSARSRIGRSASTTLFR